MITKEDFIRYLTLQHIGYTNMLDLPKVKFLTDLSKDQILDIQKNYSLYIAKFDLDLPCEFLLREIITSTSKAYSLLQKKYEYLLEKVKENSPIV